MFRIKKRYFFVAVTIGVVLVILTAILFRRYPHFGYRMIGRPTPTGSSRFRTPVFADYSATGTFEGKPAAVYYRKNVPALQFKTVIDQATAKGPNFAGHFTVVSWGCGTACQRSTVVDEENGYIVAYDLPSSAGLSYRLDSRLLIANPPEDGRTPQTPDEERPNYYLMDEGNLMMLGKLDIKNEVFQPAPGMGLLKKKSLLPL